MKVYALFQFVCLVNLNHADLGNYILAETLSVMSRKKLQRSDELLSPMTLCSCHVRAQTQT